MPDNLSKLLNVKIKVECDQIVSARAMRDIRDSICSWYGLNYIQIEPLIYEIGDTWMGTDKFPIKGTWPKRLANHLHKKTKISLTDSEKSVIGEIARRGMSSGTFYGCIVDHMKWKRGQFGDDGSCFWGDRAMARIIIPFNGGGAVQWFTDEDMEEGCSRALILPVPKRGYIVFNAYGKVSLETSADAIAKTFGLDVPVQVEFTDHGESSLSDMWINGGRGILISTSKTTKQAHSVNLDLLRPRHCHVCDRFEPEVHIASDSRCCDQCLASAHTCKHCKQKFFDGSDIEDVCAECRWSLYGRCIYCGNSFLLTDLNTQSVCKSCDESIRTWISEQTPRRFVARSELRGWMESLPHHIQGYLRRLWGASSIADYVTWMNSWFEQNVGPIPNRFHEGDRVRDITSLDALYGEGVIVGKSQDGQDTYIVCWDNYTPNYGYDEAAIRQMIADELASMHPYPLTHLSIHSGTTLALASERNVEEPDNRNLTLEALRIASEYLNRPIARRAQFTSNPETLVGRYINYQNHIGKIVYIEGSEVLARFTDMGWTPTQTGLDNARHIRLDLGGRYYWINLRNVNLVNAVDVPIDTLIQLEGN